MSTDQKEVGAIRVCWALVHHVGVDDTKRLWLMEIYISFRPGFGTDVFGVISTIPDDHAPFSILHVLELKIEHFPWPETTMQHEQEHGLVSLELERVQELTHLLVVHRTRDMLHRFDTYRSSDRLLSGSSTHEGAVPFRHACESGVIDFLDRILALGKLSRKNEIFVKR